MIKVSYRLGVRNKSTSLLALLALAVAVPVSACGSSSSATATAASSPSATQATCEQVSLTLSDGPDPGTDPVGYAEAQVQPLQQIHTSVSTLGTAITALASAYQGYYAQGGKSKAATGALNTAMNTINKLCPDAGASA